MNLQNEGKEKEEREQVGEGSSWTEADATLLDNFNYTQLSFEHASYFPNKLMQAYDRNSRVLWFCHIMLE